MGTPLRFPAGQTIFWEGQPSRSVLVIRSGNVKITKKAPDGAEVVLAIRGSTEIMGDEGVLMTESRFATVTAITDVEGLDVDADDLLRFVDDHRLWPLMYRAVVRRRRQADEQALIARADVKRRLACWLLDLAHGHRNDVVPTRHRQRDRRLARRRSAGTAEAPRAEALRDDAWDEADEAIKEKPLEHFQKAAEIQFQELKEHWDRHDRERASREAADLVSVAFNVLRWMDYSCDDIARIAQDRAEHRMKGQALGILQKYEETYGI